MVLPAQYDQGGEEGMGRKKPRLDQILVIDIEATCWDGEISQQPEGAQNDIIEIGLALLECGPKTQGSVKIVSQKSDLLVRPERSGVSEFCTQLTGWTQGDVDAGTSFADACQILRRQYSSRRRTFASWGNYDRRQFERQCQAMNVPYPFGPNHLNVKDLFAHWAHLSQHVDMSTALNIMHLPLIGKHHKGRDDAYNIARILGGILRGVDGLPDR